MQTSRETTDLLAELYERSSVVGELDGPQVEAWVSGLFALFDDEVSALDFATYCAAKESAVGWLVCAAMAELTTGLDPALSEFARSHAEPAGPSPAAFSPVARQIGQSELAGAWMVRARFGASIVLSFVNRANSQPSPEDTAPPEDPAPDAIVDLRHSILVEIGDDGTVEDLQLAGPAPDLLDEANAADDRVVVTARAPDEAIADLIAGWPTNPTSELGPGFAANQQFVRRRVFAATGHVLDVVVAAPPTVDLQRGLTDDEFNDANRAARSTLQAAVGDIDTQAGSPAARHAWADVIRGHAGDLSPRERDALLWLEWADWLGAGIGLLRAGAPGLVDGAALVDHVNRCPEVSSTIDKADRDYAEWAFEVALDLLDDAGVVQDGQLTADGYTTLAAGMSLAWSTAATSGDPGHS